MEDVKTLLVEIDEILSSNKPTNDNLDEYDGIDVFDSADTSIPNEEDVEDVDDKIIDDDDYVDESESEEDDESTDDDYELESTVSDSPKDVNNENLDVAYSNYFLNNIIAQGLGVDPRFDSAVIAFDYLVTKYGDVKKKFESMPEFLGALKHSKKDDLVKVMTVCLSENYEEVPKIVSRLFE